MFIYLTEKKEKNLVRDSNWVPLGYEVRHLPLSYSHVQIPPYGFCGLEQIGQYLLNESVNQNSANPKFLLSSTLRAHIKSFARTAREHYITLHYIIRSYWYKFHFHT